MAKFKTIFDPRTKTKSVVAFTSDDSDTYAAMLTKKEEINTERTSKRTTKDSDGTFELMHQGNTKLKTDAAGVIVSGTVTGTTFSGSGASLTNLNASKLSSGTVPSARLSLSASDIPNLATSKITSGTFADARIAASSVTQHQASLSVTESQISDLGSYITASSTDTLTNKSISAGQVNSGTLADARIPNLAASKITSGTFDAARIPSLNASKITAGTIDSDRLPTGTFGGGGGGGSTSPGGSNTQVQFNNSGSFGGDAGLTFNATSNDLTVSGKVNAATVDLGNWTITESSGVLYFATGGTNKMKLDASGNLTVVGNVTAYGSM